MTVIRTQLGSEEGARRQRFEPTGGISATNVQDAIVEAKADVDTAVEISFTPDGSIAASNVQAAIVEVRDEAQPLDATLTALAALDATAGIITQTAADTFVRRTLSAPAAGITITNPAGTAGNPTFALANDLAAVEGLALAGLAARTASDTWAVRTITAPAAGITVSDGDGVAGNPTLALANDLAAIEGLATTGLIARTADGTASTRAVTAPAAGITVSNGDGVAGNPTLALANDLAALEGLASTGLAARTASDTWAQRTITGTASEITVTNGDGVSGNPTLALHSGVYRSGGTDVPVTDGGTGGSTAADALTNLTARGQGKETIFIPASSMKTRTTNGAATGTAELATNKVMLDTLDFDSATQEFAQFSVWFPKSWNLGTVTFQPSFSQLTTAAGGVVFGLAGVAVSDGDDLDAAFGTAQTSTKTAGTLNKEYQGPESSAITIAGTPAAGDRVIFQINRTVSDGSDTLAQDARLHGVRLFLTTNATTDA